mgnify:CR=1 FL=1
MSAPSAAPLQAVTAFAAHLREYGYRLGIAEVEALVDAAERVGLASVGRSVRGVEAAWRAIACSNAREWRRWPGLFEGFWFPQRVKGTVRMSGQARPSRDLRQLVQALQQGGETPSTAGSSGPMDTAVDHPSAGEGPDSEGSAERARGGASRVDALHDRSLSMWLPQDLNQLNRLAERIAERLRRRLTRRWQSAAQQRRLDVRRTLRQSLRTGGVPVTPAWQSLRRERPRLFILVDVSRSMETHAQLFLRIARAFVQAAQARVFVFHTRLAEVTPLLLRDSGSVQEKINAVTAGFGGGTRIATSLQDFHRVHARHQLGRSSRVWVLSDGFDADEPERLGEELAGVRATGARLLWLHPSAQVPQSGAITAALGKSGQPGRSSGIEAFARLNSLSDLEAFARHAR